MRRWILATAWAGLLVSVTGTVSAEVVRIEITERQPYAEGRPIGERGPCEHLRGTVRFAVDPQHPSNRGIVDLDLAPRNGKGQVEFSAEIELLLPVDRRRVNGTLFYEVNNRGKRTSVGIFDGGADDFLLRQGFVVVSSGWIAEVQPTPGLTRLDAPIPTQDGQPLRGVVRAEIVLDAPQPRAPLCHRGAQGNYRPSARGLPSAVLTRRVREADPRETVPRDEWRFVVRDVPGGQLPMVELEVDGGLQPGLIYEAVYEAEGSVVQGAGFAGIRDLISFLKHDGNAGNPLAVDGKSIVARAIGFGTSQSGRALRQFLHEGFNADERGRIAFEGLLPHVAGGGLGSFNHRFASPTRTNGQHDEHTFPADYFPFAYGDERDSFSGRTDGLLARSRASQTVPRLMHTQSSSEYWHRSGSLVHTDPLGRRDSDVPPEVRFYTFAGTQHSAGSGLPAARGPGQSPSNPADYRPLMRALLIALHDWIARGVEPPPSVYPRIADGTLVDWTKPNSGWPAVPDVHYPQAIQRPVQANRGPEWLSHGRAAIEPPEILGHYPVLVPKHGPDGNELGCLAIPAVAVPVATYASWNLRHASIGAEGELLGLQGSYLPFAKDAGIRHRTNDPRPSLVERYGDFATYRKKFRAASERLVAERYLLAEELPRLDAFCEKLRSLFPE